MAHELEPEELTSLTSLADIQRQKGDLESLDITLERLLTINPDDIQVLQEQILLVIDSDPERVFRNKKRLESLGIETEFDSQNKTELSEIVERANEIGRQINPFGKQKTLRN